MARFSPENEAEAHRIISRYPRPASALVPLLHLAQSQDGYVSEPAMVHIGELVGMSSAQVLGTCSFYEMFKLSPVGKYLINICTNISCELMGANDLIDHAKQRLGVPMGETTADGMFTLEGAECQAACTEAPCLQVNYRYRYKVEPEDFDTLVEDLAAGRLDEEVPRHGVVARVTQDLPSQRAAGPVRPDDRRPPVWMQATDQEDGS